MSNRFKKPEPQQGSRIKTDPNNGSVSDLDKRMVFSFEHFNNNCLSKCGGQELTIIHNWLNHQSKKTLLLLKQSPRQNSFEKISTNQLKGFQWPLPNISEADCARLNLSDRVIAHLDRNIIHVIWYCFNHSCY